jgi:hypothetical protein
MGTHPQEIEGKYKPKNRSQKHIVIKTPLIH